MDFDGSFWEYKVAKLTRQSLCFGPVQPPAQKRWQHSRGLEPKQRPWWHCGEHLILLNFWQFTAPTPQQPSAQES